jgi:MOSC domain-containing protein YiiM
MGTAESLSVCINSVKTGFYFRVLIEGIIQSGDRIEIDYTNDTAPTVEEVHRLYYLDKKNLDGLTKAAQCESLTRVFRDEFENRISKLVAKTQR